MSAEGRAGFLFFGAWIFVFLFILFVGIMSSIYRTDNRLKIPDGPRIWPSKFNHENHQYIAFLHGNDASVEHDPDCRCHKMANNDD